MMIRSEKNKIFGLNLYLTLIQEHTQKYRILRIHSTIDWKIILSKKVFLIPTQCHYVDRSFVLLSSIYYNTLFKTPKFGEKRLLMTIDQCFSMGARPPVVSEGILRGDELVSGSWEVVSSFWVIRGR
jgi:hypothetical protein